MMRMIALTALLAVLLAALMPTSALAAKRKKEEKPPEFKRHAFEHHYQLQDDSYEATDTEGGYRHYVCAD